MREMKKVLEENGLKISREKPSVLENKIYNTAIRPAMTYGGNIGQ